MTLRRQTIPPTVVVMEPNAVSADFGDIIGTLRTVLNRLQVLSSETTTTVVGNSRAPDHMAKAYACLASGGSAAEGRIALSEGLIADGLDEAAISAIDAHYLRCLVGGPTSNPL